MSRAKVFKHNALVNNGDEGDEGEACHLLERLLAIRHERHLLF